MNEQTARRVLSKASVFVGSDPCPFVVAQTPREVAEMVGAASQRASDSLIELTLGSSSGWNGRSVFIRASAIRVISPPSGREDEDE